MMILMSKDGLSKTEIAKRLGVSDTTVSYTLRKVASGEDFKPALPDEWFEFLASKRGQGMDPGRAAEHLGATVSQVQGIRDRLRKFGVIPKVKGSPAAYNPHATGTRTLLARTCPECGLFLPVKFFRPYKIGGRKGETGSGTRYRSKCTRCDRRGSFKKDGREYQDQMRALSLPFATKNYQDWTNADDEFVKAHYGTTHVLAIAKELNRTYDAVRNRANKTLGLTSTRSDSVAPRNSSG